MTPSRRMPRLGTPPARPYLRFRPDHRDALHDRLHRRLGPSAVRQARGPRVESLIVEAATPGARRCRRGPGRDRRDRARPLQRRLRPPGLHQPRSSSRPTRPCASSPRPGSRTPAPPARPPSTQGLRAIAAREARIVLVVGVEKMTELAGPAIGDTLLQATYLKEEQDIEGGFAGVFGRIAQSYFQRHGDQSDALAAIAAKNHKNGCANPYAQLRKDLGFEFCRQPSPTRTRSSPARSSAPTARWSPTAPPPSSWPTSTPRCAMPKAVAFRGLRPGQRLPADEPPRHRRLRGLQAGLEEGARARPASPSTTSTSSRPTTASPSPSCSNTRPWA